MAKSKVAPILCATLFCGAVITSVLTGYFMGHKALTKEKEFMSWQSDVYGCCPMPDKDIPQLIEEGWTVTNVFGDGCGNITVELER